MSRFICLATLVALVTPSAHAQLSRLRFDIETSVSYGPRWSRASQRDPVNATPVAVHVAYVRSTSPWGAEFGVELGGLRQSAAGRLKELGVSIGVSRRLSPAPKAQATSGLYALASLTQTLLAPSSDARFAKLYGYAIGLSQRVAIGRSGVVRADITYSHDTGRDFEARYYPGSEGVAIRLGLGLRNNF